MYKRKLLLVVAVVAFCLFLKNNIFASSVPEEITECDQINLEDPKRKIILPPELVIKTLKIKPGMHILDLGAGTGYFTFPFAEALNNTGKVFAVDSIEEMTMYIKNKLKINPYKNIFPVLVKMFEFDPFYRQNTFDIIFVCEVLPVIGNLETFFLELRPSLVKGTGRLFIIEFKPLSDFSLIDFGDFKQMIKILISKGYDFPVSKRLNKEVRDFIKNWQGNDIPSEIQTEIIQDFNKMLADRFLLDDLFDFIRGKVWLKALSPTFSKELMDPYDVQLINWLVSNLESSGVFDWNKKILSDTEKEQLHKLNELLLRQILRLDKFPGFESKSDFFLVRKKISIVSKLELAGYKLVKDYDFLPQYYFLEFERSD